MAARKRPARRQSTSRRRTRGRSGAARRTAKRAKRPTRRGPARKAAAARKPRKRAVTRTAARRPRKTAVRAPRKTPVRARRETAAGTRQRARRPTSPVLLDRDRRRLPEAERIDTPPDAQDERLIAAARTGHDELQRAMREHTETSPKLTAGDLDASWTEAYAVGDETPGGDNPTPGQDRVDDIGRALGVQYRDDEELNPDEKVRERDRHRWELDPASSEDWPHKPEDKK